MENDRVSYSYGSKESNGNFGSANVNFSYSTDVKQGESPEQAMARAMAFVHSCSDGGKTNQKAQGYAASDKVGQARPTDVKPNQGNPGASGDARLGAYVIQMGKKYKGRKLSDILPFELGDYVAYLTKEGPPKAKIVAETVKAIEDYLNSVK